MATEIQPGSGLVKTCVCVIIHTNKGEIKNERRGPFHLRIRPNVKGRGQCVEVSVLIPPGKHDEIRRIIKAMNDVSASILVKKLGHFYQTTIRLTGSKIRISDIKGCSKNRIVEWGKDSEYRHPECLFGPHHECLFNVKDQTICVTCDAAEANIIANCKSAVELVNAIDALFGTNDGTARAALMLEFPLQEKKPGRNPIYTQPLKHTINTLDPARCDSLRRDIIVHGCIMFETFEGQNKIHVTAFAQPRDFKDWMEFFESLESHTQEYVSGQLISCGMNYFQVKVLPGVSINDLDLMNSLAVAKADIICSAEQYDRKRSLFLIGPSYRCLLDIDCNTLTFRESGCDTEHYEETLQIEAQLKACEDLDSLVKLAGSL
jgi:hypothetical protein